MKRANDFLVGLVVIGAAIAVLIGTLWMRQADIGDRRREISARFRDVGNAQVGNAVLIRGVRAGRIEKIELADRGWVILSASLDPTVHLPEDPVMLLQTSSLFGEWQAIVMSRQAVPPNREVLAQITEAAGAPPHLPGAILPDIAQLTAVAGRIAGDVASVAQRVQVAFDDRAARELRASIRDVADLSAELRRTVRTQSRNLDSVAVDVRSGMRDVERAAEALRRTAERVDSSTTSGTLHELVVDIAAASRDLRTAAHAVSTLSGDLSKSGPVVDQVLRRADTLVAKLNTREGSLGLLLNDPSLYRNSDSLAIELRALIADLKKNPKKYINVSVF